MKISDIQAQRMIPPVSPVTDSPLRTGYGNLPRHDDPAPKHPAATAKKKPLTKPATAFQQILDKEITKLKNQS